VERLIAVHTVANARAAVWILVVLHAVLGIVLEIRCVVAMPAIARATVGTKFFVATALIRDGVLVFRTLFQFATDAAMLAMNLAQRKLVTTTVNAQEAELAVIPHRALDVAMIMIVLVMILLLILKWFVIVH